MKLLMLVLLLTSTASWASPVVDLDSPALKGYMPSVLTGEQILELGSKIRKGPYEGAQNRCAERAQAWTYQMHGLGVDALKVFIFYGSDYPRPNQKWWYHVVPAVMVKDQEKPIVLDYFLSATPTELPNCTVVTRYSEYEKQVDAHPEACFMLFSSPYYVIPGELEAIETEHYSATEFDVDAVQRSVKRAFK